MAEDTPAIQFVKAARHFRQGGRTINALRGVDLSVGRGEFLAIVGRSGSGKSTLLNLACGIERPSSGKVVVLGQDLALMRDDNLTLLRRGRIGMIFQFFNLIPTLSALENVLLPAYLEGRAIQEARKRALGFLEEFGLLERADEYPDHFSGGEQQRLAIARALMNKPDIILADEPTGNLDSESALFVLDKLRFLATKSGCAILMVTHSSDAVDYADRAVRIADGSLIEGTPSGKVV
ncbi:MAG: ABC transporter ATP-binding protein [Candidatus Sumerlaeaceae bacterium]|nr:ABC transporter ATP-binding protein [Candidatus Sumerlaeaceae bacterium]